MANSLAIMTDAVHMLADLIGILVSLLALWLSARAPTARFTFGLHRLGTCRVSAAPPQRLCFSTEAALKACGSGVQTDRVSERNCDQQCSPVVGSRFRCLVAVKA